MKVKDLKNVFESLCPVLVKYNGEIIFDDSCITTKDEYTIMSKRYKEFMNSENDVKSFETIIVNFHHSQLDIRG